jgi:hypothetical protein
MRAARPVPRIVHGMHAWYTRMYGQRGDSKGRAADKLPAEMQAKLAFVSRRQRRRTVA